MSIQSIGGNLEAVYVAMIELQQEQSRGAHEDRRAAEQAQVEAIRDRAEHIEDAALYRALSKANEGLGEMAAGGGSAAGGGGGVSDMAKGSAKLVSAGLDYRAGLEDAEATRAEADAKAQENRAAGARDIEDDARQRAQRIWSRIETAQDTDKQTWSALTRPV